MHVINLRDWINCFPSKYILRNEVQMGDSNDYPAFKIQEWKSWGSGSGG